MSLIYYLLHQSPYVQACSLQLDSFLLNEINNNTYVTKNRDVKVVLSLCLMQPTVIPSARTEAFVSGLESADVLLVSEGGTATKVSGTSVFFADNISINLMDHFFNSRVRFLRQ